MALKSRKPRTGDRVGKKSPVADDKSVKLTEEADTSTSWLGGSEGSLTDLLPSLSWKRSLLLLLALMVIGGGSYLVYLQNTKNWPLLNFFTDGDPRVQILDNRIAALETKAREINIKDEIISRLEEERKKLRKDLGKALARLETVEKSIGAVYEVIEAGARVDEAAKAKRSLKRLSDRLSALEEANDREIESTQQVAQKIVQSKSRELTERLEKLEQGQAYAKAASSALAKVEQRLLSVERRDSTSAQSVTQAAALLAVDQLRDKIINGKAYFEQLSAVKSLTRNNPKLAATLSSLDQYAESGVTTLSSLKSEFQELVKIAISRPTEKFSNDWIGKLISNFGRLVTIHRTDSDDISSIGGLLASAESRLAVGDLSGTIEIIKGITELYPDVAPILFSWQDRAKIRLSVERSIGTLQIYIVSLLGRATEE